MPGFIAGQAPFLIHPTEHICVPSLLPPISLALMNVQYDQVLRNSYNCD